MPRSKLLPSAFGIFVALLVLLDLTLHTGLGFGRLAPDLIAVAVLLAARRTIAVKAVLLALLLGLLDDAMGVGNLGGRALGLGVAALAGTWTRQVVEGEGPLFIIPYLFFGKWLTDAVVAIFRPAAAATPYELRELITTTPLEALWSAIAGSLLLVVFRLVAGREA